MNIWWPYFAISGAMVWAMVGEVAESLGSLTGEEVLMEEIEKIFSRGGSVLLVPLKTVYVAGGRGWSVSRSVNGWLIFSGSGRRHELFGEPRRRATTNVMRLKSRAQAPDHYFSLL